MKLSVVFFLFFFNSTIFSQPYNPPQSFTLHGKIKGVKSGRVILQYWGDKKYIRDTAEIKNGKFFFNGTLILPVVMAYIMYVNDHTGKNIYLEPGTINVLFTKDRFKILKVKGSITLEEQKQLDLQEKPIKINLRKLTNQLSCIRDTMEKTG